MIKELYAAHDIAAAAKKYGIVNFLEDRIDIHEKMHWQLKSFIS